MATATASSATTTTATATGDFGFGNACAEGRFGKGDTRLVTGEDSALDEAADELFDIDQKMKFFSGDERDSLPT